MGKSARIIGSEEFGLNAKDMNALLKEHGYLSGNPGAYAVTEKGEPFATERYVTNGVGGYAQYQVNYDVRTWNEDLPDALRADLAANPDGVPDVAPEALGDVMMTDDIDADYDPAFNSSRESGGGPEATWKELAVLGALLGAAVAAVHYGPPLWHEKVKPAGQRVRDRLKKRRSERSQPAIAAEDSEDPIT